MSWRDNLRPANFGGAGFHTSDRKLSGGHRIKDHKFPKNDTNYPEEFGHKTNKWTVDAYVIGDNYMSLRDGLISALQRHGPQQYSDHWGRSGVAICEDWSLQETSQDGRYCKFSLTFINAGGSGVMPLAIAATAAQLANSATALKSFAISAFKSQFRVK